MLQYRAILIKKYSSGLKSLSDCLIHAADNPISLPTKARYYTAKIYNMIIILIGTMYVYNYLLK